jgi:NCS1 family nucleobase:cation symporter-1
MAGYTIILSPICAIMIIDYWIVKRENIDVPSLYRLDGRYFYWNGIVGLCSAFALILSGSKWM